MLRRHLLAVLVAATLDAAEPVAARPKELHIGYHMFSIGAQQDWGDRRLDFAPAAQRHRTKVWVYLHAPSQCDNSHCSDYLVLGHDLKAPAAAAPACRVALRAGTPLLCTQRRNR